ncbi:kanamycin biosynthetic protein [Actinoplanes palleronii]|nr:kanamycin biosynthetic protein [Actinoplanes palleronii]
MPDRGTSAGHSVKGVAKMSFLDKAKDFIDKHDEHVDKALDKVGEQVDKRTDGKYTAHIDKGVDEAQRRTGAGDTQP